MTSDLIHLDTRPHTVIASHSRTVVVCDRDGWMTCADEHGVFIHETQMLSHYRWRVLPAVYTVECSNVQQNSLLTYAIARPGRTLRAFSGSVPGKPSPRDATEETIELAAGTIVSDGFHQDVDVRNYTLQTQRVEIEVEFDASFADLQEVLEGNRRQKGRRTVKVENQDGAVRLHWDYEASHRGQRIHRASELRFSRLPGITRLNQHSLRFHLELKPAECFHCCVELAAQVEQHHLAPSFGCYAFQAQHPRQQQYQDGATQLLTQPEQQTVVEQAYTRAVRDLSDLRVLDLDRGPDAWVPAAGIPLYVATFGRDMLTSAWQSAMAGPGILRGALRLLRELQGNRDNAWRDEEPGKMIHEAHTGPLAVLNYLPQGRYYGSFNTSPFYAIVLSEYYHWTGDKAGLLEHLPAAQAAMDWMEKYGHPGHRHFYSYRTRSSQGVKNQGWKDSNDAFVTPEGAIVPDPLATCAIQGFAWEAWLRMAELYWSTGAKREAVRAFRRAHELKKRFNDVFWMPDEQYFAMALDPKGRQVRSIGSDPGDALATGIIDRSLAGPVVRRLFSPELFSGWGVRTLSGDHAAFNPYSYHRGSVWPAENAAIAVGLRRYGFTGELNRLAEAQMRLAARFHHHRLPEVFSGHSFDRQHPFPAVYPRANAPQAWSAGAVILLLQMMLGLYPYAPARTLFLHPTLPDWLPEVTLRDLSVGDARLTLRFHRDVETGETAWTVIEKQGELRIIRQPSPWSVTAGPLERVEDLVESLAA